MTTKTPISGTLTFTVKCEMCGYGMNEHDDKECLSATAYRLLRLERRVRDIEIRNIEVIVAGIGSLLFIILFL